MSLAEWIINDTFLVLALTERKVHQTTGHVAQLSPHRLVHVQEQLSSLQPGEAAGSQGNGGPLDKHHVLQNEGNFNRF